MRRTLLFLGLLFPAAVSIAEPIFSAEDVVFWVGEGENRAVLVIDWNDDLSPASLAWGFCWSGEATGRDMLNAIHDADPRFFEQSGDQGAAAVYGLGFDLDEDGFVYTAGPNDSGHALDEDDHYREGWMAAGYWSYWGSETNPYDSGTWMYPGSGLADRLLTDGSWDGWSFAPAPEWYSGPPSVPTAVSIPIPEPGSLGLVAAGAMILNRRKKR